MKNDFKPYKVLIVLSATSGGISMASFASATVGIASESFSFAFSIVTGIIKNY